MITNCKNCGAPLTGGKCEYCGTEYDAIVVPKINPKIYPRSIKMYGVEGVTTFYADNRPVLTVDSIWEEVEKGCYTDEQQP